MRSESCRGLGTAQTCESFSFNGEGDQATLVTYAQASSHTGRIVRATWYFQNVKAPWIDAIVRGGYRCAAFEGNAGHVRLLGSGTILREAGGDFSDVVKCTCYLSDLADFEGFNRTYQEFFTFEVPPARTTVAAPLLAGIKVEIDAVARIRRS